MFRSELELRSATFAFGHPIDLSPARVCEAVRACHQNLRNPPKMVEEYLDTLLRQELPHAVAAIRIHCFGGQ